MSFILTSFKLIVSPVPNSYLRSRQALSHTDPRLELMPFPDLLPSLPPSLSERLRFRTNSLRSKIVRTNYNTQFAQTARELLEFRHVIAGLVDEMDDDVLSESFQKTVHFTTYDSYGPLLARFSEKPFKASSIVDLFAPGFPDCLAESSSTSGGLAKTFPKYNIFSGIGSSGVGSFQISDPLRRRTSARVYYLGSDQLDVEIKTIVLLRKSISLLGPLSSRGCALT